MRKLKLQMQLTTNGFSCGPNGELDWMTWNWDDELKNYVTGITNSFDTILLGRKMTDGFISYWTEVTKIRIILNITQPKFLLILLKLFSQKHLIKAHGQIP